MMNPKPILLISRCPPYPIHLGDRLIVWHLARELSQQGYAIDLVAFSQLATDLEEVSEYASFFRRVTLIPEPKRSPVSYAQRVLLPSRRFPKNAQGSWSAPMWDTIAQHLAQYEYGVVHLFGGVQVYEYAHLLHQQAVLITPYESFTLFLQRLIAKEGGFGNRVRAWIARQFEGFMFTPYRAVTVLSEADGAMLKEINPALNVHVIPNGVDLAQYQLSTMPRQPETLLFVGNYAYQPNADAVIYFAQHLLPRIQQVRPQVQFWIVGNAPPPTVQALASETITVTGFVDDLRPYYQQATVFVCPLQVGAGIKNKVLEALAMGLPVVSTSIGVDGVAVKDGESVRVSAIETFAETVLDVLNNPAQQVHLSQHGRQVIETRYSWATVAQAYATLYDAVGSANSDVPSIFP